MIYMDNTSLLDVFASENYGKRKDWAVEPGD